MEYLKGWTPTIICFVFLFGLWSYIKMRDKMFQDKINQMCSSGEYVLPPVNQKIVSKIEYNQIGNDCILYIVKTDEGEMYNVSKSYMDSLKIDVKVNYFN